MIDYSEGFLLIDKNLREAYKLMLKNDHEGAANLLRELSRISNGIADDLYLGEYK